MSVDVKKTTIETYQGDTCEILFNDLTPGLTIGFQVRDRLTNEPVFDEMKSVVNSEGEVTFTITPEMSNKFVVDPRAGINAYYYGIKQYNTETGEENTIQLGEKPKFSDKYVIKVFIKKVEGNKENG